MHILKSILKNSIYFFILLQLSWGRISWAQDNGGESGSGNSSNILDASMEDLSIVAGLGITGAILGLSTLSFVKYPKNHMRHILVGGSAGIIVGVIYVAYYQATESQERIFKDNGDGGGNRDGQQAYLLDKVRANDKKEFVSAFEVPDIKLSVNLFSF